MDQKIYGVPFLCTGNSTCSILVEGSLIEPETGNSKLTVPAVFPKVRPTLQLWSFSGVNNMPPTSYVPRA